MITKKKFHVKYEVEDSKLHLTPIEVINQRNKDSKIFIQEFYYLNAERIGPRIKQEIKIL